MLAVKIIICAVILIIVIFVLIGLAFSGGYKKDQKEVGPEGKYLWRDRKRNWLGLPWSFVKYSLSEDRIFIQRGFFKTTYDEARLYRILDLKMTQGLWQKINNVGTIQVHSSDKSLGCFSILNIKNPMQVKEMLSEQVEEQRDKHRVYSRETMQDTPDDFEEHDFNDAPDYDGQ